MKLVIGSPARKEQFYPRPQIRKEVIEALESGENILISAPRRVGKTSILFNLIDEPDPNVYTIYINTEGIDDPHQFFEIILNELLNTDRIEGFGKLGKKAKYYFKEWASRLKEINIAGIGIKLTDKEQVNCYDQLIEIFSGIDLEGKRIAILVDEFPITLEHIYQKHGLDSVKLFLDMNRSLRQNPIFQEKIKFIYCGSIGLFAVVKRLNATDRINDLREIKVKALLKKDAEKLVTRLILEKTNTNIATAQLAYILKKIEWWIPFYFQLLVKELTELVNDYEEPMDNKTIDKAFSNVIKNGNIYFEHFKSRLARVFEKESLMFSNELLLTLKQKEFMEFNEVLNLAEKHNVRVFIDDILEILEYDGYIIEDNKEYKFYSPILKNWWK